MPDLPEDLKTLLKQGRDHGLAGDEFREAVTQLLQIVAEQGGLDWPQLARLYETLTPRADRLVSRTMIQNWIHGRRHPNNATIEKQTEALADHVPKAVSEYAFRFSRLRWPTRGVEDDETLTRPAWAQVLANRGTGFSTFLARCRKELGEDHDGMMRRLRDALPPSYKDQVAEDAALRWECGEGGPGYRVLRLHTWRAWGRPCGVTLAAWEEAIHKQRKQWERAQEPDAIAERKRRELAIAAEKEMGLR